MSLFVQFRNWLCRGLAGAALLAAQAGSAWAQCAMCREAAKSQNAEAIEALTRGILVLAAPPLAILLGIGVLTYRYRNSSPAPYSKHSRPSSLRSGPSEGH